MQQREIHMTLRALTGLLLCLAIAACSGPTPRPAADPAAMAHGAAVTPAADPAAVEKRYREAWLAQTDPQALDVLRFWFEEWDEDRVQGGKGRYNDKWFPHGPLGAAGSAEIDREIRQRTRLLLAAALEARSGLSSTSMGSSLNTRAMRARSRSASCSAVVSASTLGTAQDCIRSELVRSMNSAAERSLNFWFSQLRSGLPYNSMDRSVKAGVPMDCSICAAVE
jgi:hypothetical protein